MIARGRDGNEKEKKREGFLFKKKERVVKEKFTICWGIVANGYQDCFTEDNTVVHCLQSRLISLEPHLASLRFSCTPCGPRVFVKQTSNADEKSNGFHSISVNEVGDTFPWTRHPFGPNLRILCIVPGMPLNLGSMVGHSLPY